MLLGGCVTENADFRTGDVLSSRCIDKQQGSNFYWDYYPFQIGKVYKIGAIVHPHNQSIRRRPWGYSTGHEFGPQTISISIIPYIITDSGNRFYLLPEVAARMKHVKKNEPNYYPACQENSYQLGFAHPELYPSVLLKLENPSDLKMLEQGLKSSLSKRLPLEFTSHPIAFTYSVMSMDLLVETILQQKQAKFLENYDFSVEVESSKKSPIRFKAGDKLKKITDELDELKKVCSRKPITSRQVSDDKLIIVSLSSDLRTKTRTIQNSFLKVLSELKRKNSKTRFALLTVQSGRKISKVLTSQELQSLAIKGSNSIKSTLELNMNFRARDLKALADLSLVDSILQEQAAMGSILYITDNKRINTNIQEIPSQQRGVPLVWHKDGIALTVLTIKDCKVWEYMEAKCVTWNNQTDLIRELKTFFYQ